MHGKDEEGHTETYGQDERKDEEARAQQQSDLDFMQQAGTSNEGTAGSQQRYRSNRGKSRVPSLVLVLTAQCWRNARLR